MKSTITLLFIITCFFACKENQSSDSLKRLTLEESIARLNKGDHQYYYAKYKDSVGQELSPELKEKLTKGKLSRSFYVDQNDSIKEIRVKILQEKDIFDEIQLRCAMTFPLKNFKFEKIDCSKIKDIIGTSYDNDQGARQENKVSSDIREIDRVNKNTIISILEKCGWSAIDTSQINEVFLMVQHMDTEFVARYYPTFMKYYDQGILSKLNYARMVDRLHMNNGFEQIYGTQIVDESFYDIKDEINVNERRKKLGLSTIEEYAKTFGFEYKATVKP
ncbi:MAG TPA: DUF6624 domain-containing protein [Saprospiraceae bacterium]|nr:DUF6624 domain-containing protein [Saprospiraceae bacterium]